jgi:hypothetical protein
MKRSRIVQFHLILFAGLALLGAFLALPSPAHDSDASASHGSVRRAPLSSSQSGRGDRRAHRRSSPRSGGSGILLSAKAAQIQAEAISKNASLMPSANLWGPSTVRSESESDRSSQISVDAVPHPFVSPSWLNTLPPTPEDTPASQEWLTGTSSGRTGILPEQPPGASLVSNGSAGNPAGPENYSFSPRPLDTFRQLDEPRDPSAARDWPPENLPEEPSSLISTSPDSLEVPEPSTWSLIAIALGMIFCAARTRLKRSSD